jgi:hypothetical protein
VGDDHVSHSRVPEAQKTRFDRTDPQHPIRVAAKEGCDLLVAVNPFHPRATVVICISAHIMIGAANLPDTQMGKKRNKAC